MEARYRGERRRHEKYLRQVLSRHHHGTVRLRTRSKRLQVEADAVAAQLCPRQSKEDVPQKLIALGRTLPTKDKVQQATVNKHVTNLAEYWSYLVTQKKIPRRHEGSFCGTPHPPKKGRKARNERHNWTPTLEKELFKSPLYRGCASIHRRATPGSQIFRDALFWMPLLGRTMGTRENEICDAFVGDIKLEETNGGPIWYLEIIDGKDSGSERRVPFADLVLGIGFLEQRVIGRDPDQPLFPKNNSAGDRNAPVGGLYRPLRPLQAENQDPSPSRGFSLRFAATLKPISKTCPRPIRHG